LLMEGAHVHSRFRLTCAGYTSLRSVAAAQSASRTLRILDASHNVLFNGSLPSVFSALPELRNLRLADCNFSGSIPGARRRATWQAQSLHIEDPAGAWGYAGNSTPSRPLQVQIQEKGEEYCAYALCTANMPGAASRGPSSPVRGTTRRCDAAAFLGYQESTCRSECKSVNEGAGVSAKA